MFFDAFVSYENIILEVAKDGFEGDGAGEEEIETAAQINQWLIQPAICKQ